MAVGGIRRWGELLEGFEWGEVVGVRFWEGFEVGVGRLRWWVEMVGWGGGGVGLVVVSGWWIELLKGSLFSGDTPD
jgi:hypothetical protein